MRVGIKNDVSCVQKNRPTPARSPKKACGVKSVIFL